MPLKPDSPYGITHGIFGTSGTLSQNIVNWSDQMGLSWFRVQMDFSLIWLNQSDTEATWNWNPLDTALVQLQTAGFNIVFPIRNLPAWALKNPAQQAARSQDGTGNFFQADPTMFARVATAVAQRYNGVNNCISNGTNHGKIRIQAIELGNEEFNIDFSNPSLNGTASAIFGIYNSPYSVYNGLNGISSLIQPTRDPHFWVPIAKAAYPAIKNVDPTFLVGMCSLWWKNTDNYTDFMKGVYAEGGKNFFDYANYHFYSDALDPITGSTAPPLANFQDGWKNIHSVMQANGDGAKPVWVTEFGWNVPSQVTAAVEGTNYNEVLENARKSGVVQKVFVYTIHDRKDTTASNFDQATIVYWGYGQAGSGTSYVFLPAYTGTQNYLTTHPTWGSTGGGGLLDEIDTFQDRTVTSGWGTASDKSGDWKSFTEVNATAPTLSISPSGGALFTGPINCIANVLLGTNTFSDGGVVVRLKVSAVGNNAGVSLRSDATGDIYYRCSLSGNVLELAYMINGATGRIDLYLSPPLNYQINHYYYIRFEAVGNVLRGRYWDSGSTEPSDWASPYGFQYTLTGSDPVLTSGQFGLRARTVANSATINFDSFEAYAITAPATPNPLRGNAQSHFVTHTGSSATHPLVVKAREKFSITGVTATHLLGNTSRSVFKVAKSLGGNSRSHFIIADKPLLQALMIFPGRDGVQPLKGRDGIMNIKGRDGVMVFKGRNGKSISFKGRGSNR